MKMLRLAGAPGVGKSTTGWAIALDLAANGIAAAYVDIDQLGMCYPSPDGDPDRWVLKERVLAGIAEIHRSAGVTHMVVSGVAQAAKPLPSIKNVLIRAVWLDASEEARRGRLDVRRLTKVQLEQSLAAGTAEDEQVHPTWLRVETENRSEPETVNAVLAHWESGCSLENALEFPEARQFPALPGGRVLWITGPRLAGASRIAWEIANEDWRNGHQTGFADVTQLSFTWNIADDLGVPALACLSGSFHEAGAASIIIVAPLGVDPAAVRAALPNSQVTFVRLTPSEQDLRRHASCRQDGYGAVLAGDDVRGTPDSVIDALIRSSKASSLLPLREHERRVDTQGLSLVDAVAAVRREAKW